MLSLLSYGEVLVDFLPSSAHNPSYTPLAGGAPANVAVAFAKLGGNSYFAGGISSDDFGTMLMQQLQDQGVNTSYVNTVENANTAIVLVTLDASGERAFNFYRNDTADMYYEKSQVDKINWQDMAVFHYCSNTLTNEQNHDNTLYALKRAKSNKVLISFDVNLRQQLWADLSLLPARVEACLNESDIVKLSKDEARYLAAIKNVDIPGYVSFLLALGVKLIVITDGPNEVQVTCASYSLMMAVPKITALDTTAAGDSFIASFLFYLCQDADINQACLFSVLENQTLVSSAVLFASKCGASTCQKMGAFAALPSIKALAL
ncbi:carbohydrate kinase [Colwellia sp. MB02u-6]|uniref:carbohydrate kinase family protein n=1 Tax=Colwellia sp. MB02u-6 TaxID=2759824 RepID=UPI0015F5CCA3|nr:carbohydrate kinase [Colwellia sp. MB02u-6]MBA6328317.1 carbohydrate kinase [Colwellia sp. MB02u-6]